MDTQKQNNGSEKPSKGQKKTEEMETKSKEQTPNNQPETTKEESQETKTGHPTEKKTQEKSESKDTGDNVEVISDISEAFPDNTPVNPDKFTQERQGTYEQENEEEFERPGEKPSFNEEETGEKEGSKHNMEYYTTKAVLKFSEFGLGTWHERRRFTPEERKRIKQIRRKDSEELEEEEQKLWQQYQETKKEQKEELEFDDDEIDSIVEPLKELALHSNIKIDDPRVALIFCLAVIMWPRIQFVMQG